MEPPADLRQSTQIGRFMEFAERRCDRRFARLRRSVAVVGGGSRGVLGVDLGVLRAAHPRSVRARAGLARDAGSACGFRARGSTTPSTFWAARRTPTRWPWSPIPRPAPELEVTFGELREQVARARAGLQRLGRRARRPRRRLHAQHPRDARGLHRHRQPGSHLGRLRPGVRRAQRHRPLRPDRAQGDAGRRRLRLPRPLCEPRWPRSRRSGPPDEPGARRGGALRRGHGARRRGLVRPAERARPARVRAGSLRPPALRAVLLGDDRPAQGDRPRPRRPARGAPQEPGLRLGPRARQAPAVVLHHGVDDVERAGQRAAAADLDRDARRRSGVAGPGRAVAAGRALPADGDGRLARPT